MAHYGSELAMCLEEIDISSVVKIQALFRGFLVRKWFQELKDVYTAVVSEIQRDTNVDVLWGNSLCKPKVVKKSKRKRKNVQGTNSPKQENTHSTCNALDAVMQHTADERITQDLLQRSYLCGTEDSPRNYDSKDSFHSKNLKSSDAQTDDIYNTEADTKEAILNSVETQTSMIEVIHDISNDSSEHMYADHEIRTVTNPDNTNQDSSKDIQIPIETNTDELQNQLELQLDIQTFEFDCASKTTHKLPDETGSSLNTEKPVLKDFDRDSDKSENFCDRRSDISDTSNQTSIRSRSPKPVGALDQQETEHDVFKDIKFRSASPSAIPEKKLSKNQSSPRPRQIRAETQRLTSYDNSTLTNVTSVWDSVNSLRGSHTSPKLEIPARLPSDPEQLCSLRKNIAMELLWVQQAINSRKNYLRLKEQM